MPDQEFTLESAAIQFYKTKAKLKNVHNSFSYSWAQNAFLTNDSMEEHFFGCATDNTFNK